MASMSDMPHMARQEIAIGARHRSSLEYAFLAEKQPSKAQIYPIFEANSHRINALRGSDPD
jgi:hypothetical protein